MARTERTHIAIPKDLKDRLDKHAERLNNAAAAGQTKVAPIEQGDRGTWVSSAQVIAHALDHLEAHMDRSRKAAKKAADNRKAARSWMQPQTTPMPTTPSESNDL